MAKQKDIDRDKFLEMLKFSVEKIGLFNERLYKKGYIFSEAFLQSFEGAGLFANRKMKITDILERVEKLSKGVPLHELNSVLSEINSPLTQANKDLSSVQAPKGKNSITDNSKEKVEDSEEKKKNSKGEINLNKSREPINEKGKSEEKGSSAPTDEEELFF